MDLPISGANIIDMKTILGGGNGTLLGRMKEHYNHIPLTSRLSDLDQKLDANYRAIRLAHLELGSHLDLTMPPEFFTDYLKARCESLRYLYLKFIGTKQIDEWWRRSTFIRSVHEMEMNGIYIDKDYVDSELKKNHDVATMKCLRSMQTLYRNGYVTALYNAAGTKTGRLRPEGGFTSMGIPHGPARNAIISRHVGGKIYSFDYNAIDYRSIVNAIGGDFAAQYSDSRDFHAKTTQFLSEEFDESQRDIVKSITYTSIYGGSIDTLSQKTGLSTTRVEMILEKLETHLYPISALKQKIWGEFQMSGFIDIPGIGRYEASDEENMHAGKLLALFAQGYSAYVFEMSFIGVHNLLKDTKSCIIFPVHDELVLDIHPDDERDGIIEKIKHEMESGVATGFVVNYKKGRSYGEIE